MLESWNTDICWVLNFANLTNFQSLKIVDRKIFNISTTNKSYQLKKRCECIHEKIELKYHLFLQGWRSGPRCLGTQFTPTSQRQREVRDDRERKQRESRRQWRESKWLHSKHNTLIQSWYDVGPTSTTLAQHQSNIKSMHCVCWFTAVKQSRTEVTAYFSSKQLPLFD